MRKDLFTLLVALAIALALVVAVRAWTDPSADPPSNNVAAPVQLDAGYLRIPSTSAGAPVAGDCDADAERGRLVIDTTNNILYVCNGATRKWDSLSLTD